MIVTIRAASQETACVHTTRPLWPDSNRSVEYDTIIIGCIWTTNDIRGEICRIAVHGVATRIQPLHLSTCDGIFTTSQETMQSIFLKSYFLGLKEGVVRNALFIMNQIYACLILAHKGKYRKGVVVEF